MAATTKEGGALRGASGPAPMPCPACRGTDVRRSKTGKLLVCNRCDPSQVERLRGLRAFLLSLPEDDERELVLAEAEDRLAAELTFARRRREAQR